MKADLPKREPDSVARWEEIGLYARLREAVGRAGRSSCCTTARPTPTATSTWARR